MSTLLTPAEVAEMRRCSIETLSADRVAGRGIPYVKDGRRVLYRREDVEKYLSALPRYRAGAR